MDLEVLINRCHEKFSEIDEQICRYIIQHKQKIPSMGITDLAAVCYTSKTSVLRFVQKLGFSGYTEFKYLVNWDDTFKEADTATLINHIAEATQTLLTRLNHQDFTPMFEQIMSSKNIYLISTGLNQQIQALDLQRNFLKMGISMNLLPPGAGSDLHMAVSEKISKQDLIFVFSYSGENELIKDMLAIPLLKNVKIISFTGNGHNWLKEHSCVNISLESEQFDPIIQSFSSGFFHLIIDYLSMECEKYLKAKFWVASFHPGSR